MAAKQIATRIDENEYARFKVTANRIGSSPSDVLRMFVYAFNENNGFPYEVKTNIPECEPFTSEEEADDFITKQALELMDYV